jgi:hypothetical protein
MYSGEKRGLLNYYRAS